MERGGTIMLQGMLFHQDEAAPACLTDDELIFAIAVSTVSSPARNGIWDMLQSRMPPAEIFSVISRNCRPAVQAYLTEAYPGDPLSVARMIIDAASSQSIRVLTFWDHDYPALLREVQCPPPVLYVKGEMPAGPSVAIVGTRRADTRSALIARRIAREMSARGFAVVSGMAVGVDREAHLGALDEKGRTVGVLANGIDIIYPWPNRDLFRLIETSPGSALVSEYPPGIMAGKWTFVRRNRIISGLCAGTVVVKAGERSGALITARHALEQNREVFACAGNSFDDGYAGCHRLIRNGAVLVSCTEDIVEELSRCAGVAVREPPALAGTTPQGDLSREAPEEPGPDTLASRILRFLETGDFDIDTITRRMAANPGEVNEAVVLLELGGRITRSGNIISRV